MSTIAQAMPNALPARVASLFVAVGAALASFACFGLLRTLFFAQTAFVLPPPERLYPSESPAPFAAPGPVTPGDLILPPEEVLAPVQLAPAGHPTLPALPTLASNEFMRTCVASERGGFDCADGSHVLGFDRSGNPVADQINAHAAAGVSQATSKGGFSTGNGFKKEQ